MSVADPAPAGVVADFERERRRLLVRQRAQAAFGVVLFSLLLAISLQRSGFLNADLGDDPLARIVVFLGRLNPKLRADVILADRKTAGSLAYWFYDLPLWLKAAWQTLEMAALATTMGTVGAIGASFLCARNLMPIAPVRFVVRRTLEAIRTLPEMILALILVAAFGIGPFAGVLALTISTIGGLGKLFSEINEQVDPRPLEAIEATGANRIRQIRYGVLPQVLPAYASYALIRLEGNLAAAAALGIVGAGGIGLELQRAITYTEFDTYLAILLLMVGMIFVIDIVSEQIRHRLIGLGDRRGARAAPKRGPAGTASSGATVWRRLAPPCLTLLAAAVLVMMAIDVDFVPGRLLHGAGRLGRLVGAMIPPSSGGQSLRILRSLGETVAMAFVATLIAAVMALPLGVLGAKTVVSQPAAHFLFRRVLDLFRGVPPLVWALILVSAFGLGPFAGVCALALADIPNLAKLFAESIENADARPIEGVRSTGAPSLAVVRLGLLSQVAPVMASQCLYFLESNFRNAAILGIVGAGGIGFELGERIRVFSFNIAAFIIILYMVTVALLDYVSRALRQRLG
ncbi:MAG TPA: phosphonate ABC transporter, permease protein PhnE [Caulobacteraceae bacterium]|jgi:phosphonate transport system permease protein